MKPGRAILAGRGDFAMTADGLAAWGARLETWDGTFRSAQSDTNWLGDSFPTMYMANGVAVMEVDGPMMFRASFIEKNLGAFDYQTLTGWIDQAREQQAKGALLYVNSPGGACSQNLETAECVAQLAAEMPVGVFIDQTGASAAYALSAPASHIMVSPSSMTGSIGAVLTVLDASAFLESIGLKFQTFASGKYKAAGNPTAPMTDDHKSYFQGLVSKHADAFKNFVSRFRNVAPESMEGQVFTGPDAVAAGLADELVPNLNAAIARMASGSVPTRKRGTGSKASRSQFDFKLMPSRPGQTVIHTATSLAKAIGATPAEVTALIASGKLTPMKSEGDRHMFEIAAVNRLSKQNR